MLKLSFDPPKFGVTQEVKNLLRKPPQKKNESGKFWTLRERIIVAAILIFTVLISIYFWYAGQNKTPNIRIPEIGGFSLNGTVEIK